MHVISPSILELVVRIRAAHNRPDNHIRVRISSPKIRIVSLHAPDKVLFASVRYYGCGPVVHPERVLRPEPDQVAPTRRVQPENVIDLRFGEREELVGPHRPPLAAEHAAGGPEVVGVDGHEERGGGDVLEVVPTADEEQPGRRAAHVSGIVLVQIGAYVVLCFGPDMRMSMSFDEEISPPLDRLQSVAVLTRTSNFFAIFEHGPRQQGYGKRHRKAKLDVVAGVVVASDQVHLSLNPHQIKPNGKQKTENRKRSFGVAWLGGDSLVVRQAAGALRLKVEEALGESVFVV
nr:hypothetical protein Iba_scaffold63445CG0010 [Ipomoea batatas]